jgi:PKD repeat protein
LSRFTANSGNTATVAGSEFVLYQDPQVANAEHHGGAIMFGNDGKLYFTTGEHFNAPDAQSLTNPRGKLHRINLDGSVPTDNPFYDGAGPNWDSIWAYGLRNPYRAYYDAPTGRMFIGDVGGNDYSTAREEVNIGARGANYGWPNSEGPCSAPCTSPLYYYAHNGRDASITGGFVYHGTAFPGGFDGSYLFGDYTQNWIRRLTLDGSGSLTGTINVEPADGSVDGPYGDIVYLVQGPDGAIYYLDLGYSDISGSFGISKLRRIKYVQSNQAPIVAAAASVTNGPLPLTVDFSSSGSSDPEGTALTYLWDFGDNVTSTQANPTHIYTQAGTFTARLTVSDSVNNATSTPLTISAGNKPVASILSPTDGAFFVAGNVISYSGDATDTEDGTLPASAYTWNIDFLHEGHVHPGTPVIGSKSGTFTIPTSGHDFSGNTRYRITLTVVDSNGLSDTKSVIVWPTKVNLSFATAPTGLTLYLDGIAKTSPFVYDTLVGFNHTIEARNQSANGNNYTFASWSDGGAQLHTIVVPAASSSYSATFTSVPNPAGPIAFVQVSAATPQTSQTVVSTSYTQLQRAGDFNVAVVGWNNTTSTISSVTDTLGNTYVLAAPTTRGVGISQAIYYAKNVAAGSNTVTVTFNQSTAAVDVRVLEYSGIDPVSPFDKAASASGTASSANSGSVTTTAAKELIFGAGTTTGSFSAPGTGFTTRIITTPDADIAEDRTVTATGSYSATATQSGNWVMQVVTFKGAAQ